MWRYLWRYDPPFSAMESGKIGTSKLGRVYLNVSKSTNTEAANSIYTRWSNLIFYDSLKVGDFDLKNNI
jgi:hypothetical protein